MCSNGSGDALADLESALDRLAVEDTRSMFGPQVLDRTGRLLRAQNRLDARVARSVREGELTQAAEHDGLTTMQSWLRGHARLSPAAAHRVVRAGRALEHLAAVAAAFAAGRITAEQVAVIAPVARDEHRAAATEQDVDHAAVDALLADTASTRPHRELAQVVHHYLERLDPDGPEPDPTEMRSLTLAQHPDGSVTGRFELDAVGGEKVQAVLESMLQANRPAGDIRNRSQQLGDAFVQWADNTLAAGELPFLRTVKPHVMVTIGIDDLADPHTGHGAAETGFGARISAGRARWLACDGNITRIVIGPDGQPLDIGRDKRIFPPHIRKALEVRDKGCVFTGCSAPTHWCDAHHLLEWVLDDGPTSVDNGALLCESHHTKVHHGFRVERQPDGRWRTWRPDGTEIVLHPHLLAA
ncbi:HNH endonuclease signature motif containing protein [Blastococcus sp. CT_GayMR16]|uniref:HNH endonuclease signature motif containing protein n=1 Tax=Blastococcus sp. CT_GayMR16 TaxID=2559607 RepID=UPI0010734517|nr:HNH endonuclease signature motif containing protein [Blastococcus sp. CT_GayMR16]TFV91370.1 HNH endonuclease [Blastococcus sp. CT_GayMR16]